MGRVYSVTFDNVTLANQAVTLVSIRPPTTATIEIRRCWIAQSANVTSAQQRVQLATVTTFATLTSATPAKHNLGDPASLISGGTAGAAGTSGVNSSNENGGAKSIIVPDCFNVVNGWLWVPTKDEQIVIPASSASAFVLFLPAAAATLTNWTGGVTFEEKG